MPITEVKVLRSEDMDLIKMLKADKVLSDIRPEHFRTDSGAVLIFCGDCDHANDKWEHFRSLFQESGKIHRVFPATQAGGGIWIAKSELLQKVGIALDEALFFSINAAFKHKGMTSIFPLVHAPCGAAGDFSLSLFDQLELLVKGKERLKEEYAEVEDLEVKGFFHLCLPGRRRRMYFVSAAIWNQNREKYRQFDYTPDRLFSAVAS